MKILKLYKYQNEYFDYVKENNKKNFIYDMATGTGKTIMAINHWQYYYKDKPLLVVAPASKVNEGGWQRTILEYVIKPKFEVISYIKIILLCLMNVIELKIQQVSGENQHLI